MSRVVVFDSGFGSLSIISAIQKVAKSEIIYFADQKHFPYGSKSVPELNKIIIDSISNLKRKFNPDLIVVASNTPSLLLRKIFKNDNSLVGVLPPLRQAQKITKTKSIAILATNSVVKSGSLRSYIKQNLTNDVQVVKIDASELISLVECGLFIYNESFCIEKIKLLLEKKIQTKRIDVITLSSTHLPFLLPILVKIFPDVKFLDPASIVAYAIKNNKLFSSSKKNSLKIFTSGNADKFQSFLHSIGIRNTVKRITF